jgi:hypothetical protein
MLPTLVGLKGDIYEATDLIGVDMFKPMMTGFTLALLAAGAAHA